MISRNGILTAMLILVVASLSACQSMRATPIDATSHPAERSYNTSIDLLADALPDAFDALHWGRISVRNDIATLAAGALTADGRRVDIAAEKSADGLIIVHIRVGHFGDTTLENMFFEELARQLR